MNLVLAHTVRTGIARSGEPERADQDLIVAGSLRASDGHHGHSSPRGDGGDNLIVDGSDREPQAWSTKLANTKSNQAGKFYKEYTPALAVNSPVPAVTWTYPLGPAFAEPAGVRRLTPLECERLMGWPDGWTKYTTDGKEIPDSHRYRLCGNGVVSTVAEWIGHRLVAVDRMLA